MNEKQAAIVGSFGSGLAVVAGAGCGKTTTLVAKCRELLARNPKARFCAVSFTEKSVRDLKDSLSSKLEGVDFTEHWVKTLHGLCATVLQEFPAAAGLQGGERILLEDEAERLWKRSLEVLWTSTDNAVITEALERLLRRYSRTTLEGLCFKLRSLLSFGVEDFIGRSFHRQEVKDLWLVFESIHHRYQHSKNRDGGLDFNDLERLAAKALESEAVRRHYHQRFDLVLCDEFQDTNPLQGRILEAFVKPGLSNLCIVGDPKQSIYRFRDADVTVFRDLTERLSEKHLLDENYRSRPDIIDFVNRVCAPVFAASELPYEPLLPMREPGAGRGVSILEWETEAELARYLESEQGRGVDLSEFVILARSVRSPKCQRFLAALSERGIPILLGSGGRFYEDPRVRELAALLRGWVSTKNTLSQAAALRSPWIGVGDEWLYECAKQHGEAYFQRFFESHPHPVARALRDRYLSPARLSCVRPGEILERLLELPEFDEEMVMPAVSLWHKCEEWSRSGQRFEEVVRTLFDAIEKSKIEKEIPAPAARGMVRVMTIHGSKGLQFPRVILVDFDGPSRNSNRAGDLIWDRKLGVHLLNREETGEQLEEDPENERWKELERQAAIAESKRLFYVALTRPQEELLLLWKKDVKASKKAQEAGYDPYRTDDWRAWVAAAGVPERVMRSESEGGEAERAEDPAASAAAERVEARPSPRRVEAFDSKPYRARHSPSEWLVLEQCPLRYVKKFAQVEDQPESEERRPVRPRPGSEGAHAAADEIAAQGERIHRALELEDEHALLAEFPTAEAGRTVLGVVRDFLRQGAGVAVHAELGFEVPLSAREALVGMMDRLEVEPAARKIRIIDYKFTSKEASPAELLARYGLQLRLYAHAASRLVDFEPAALEGFLLHFTREGAQVVRAPEEWFRLEALQAEVERWHRLASSLAREEQGCPTPAVGDWCRHCEWLSGCPAHQNPKKS